MELEQSPRSSAIQWLSCLIDLLVPLGAVSTLLQYFAIRILEMLQITSGSLLAPNHNCSTSSDARLLHLLLGIIQAKGETTRKWTTL